MSILMNHFEAARKLLNRGAFRGLKIRERVNLSFVDSDMVPLLCQENYLASASKNTNKSLESWKNIVQATESFVIGDMIDKSIRKEQKWSLMPCSMFMSCVYPA
jgi:replication factor C subunit 1